MTDLNRLLQRLCDAEIEFIIVGGFAAMLHGSTLLTRDLDGCAVLNPANVGKLREILRDLHPTHRLTPQRLSFLDNPSPDVPVRNLLIRAKETLGREKDLLSVRELRALVEKKSR